MDQPGSSRMKGPMPRLSWIEIQNRHRKLFESDKERLELLSKRYQELAAEAG